MKRRQDWVKREIAGWPVANLAVNNAVKVLVDQPYGSLCAKDFLVYQRDDLSESQIHWRRDENKLDEEGFRVHDYYTPYAIDYSPRLTTARIHRRRIASKTRGHNPKRKAFEASIVPA